MGQHKPHHFSRGNLVILTHCTIQTQKTSLFLTLVGMQPEFWLQLLMSIQNMKVQALEKV